MATPPPETILSHFVELNPLPGLEALCEGVDVIAALGALMVREIAADLEPGHPSRRTAFVSYHRRLLEDVSSKLGQERSWYEVLSAEEPNVRQALTWAQQDGDAAMLLDLATRMWIFWQTRGALAEGRDWLGTGLALEPPAQPSLRASALWGLAWLAYHQGDDDAAEAAGHDLAALAAEHRDPVTRRNALTIAGMVAIARDRPHDAIATLTEALGVARVLDKPWILATSLLNLGLGHLALGEPARARPVLGEALQWYDEIGDERFHARCLGYLGLASLLEGDPDRAGALFAQSLRSFADRAEPAGTAEGLAGIAAVAAATGRATTAATLSGAAERVRESVAARELPLERRATAPYLANAEHAVGPAEWARAWRSGRELTLAAAVSLALGVSPDFGGRRSPR